MKDKLIEKYRYDKRAKKLLNNNSYKLLQTDQIYLRTPYDYYFELFKKLKNKKIKKLLEIGAGTGKNTTQLVKMSFKVL